MPVRCPARHHFRKCRMVSPHAGVERLFVASFVPFVASWLHFPPSFTRAPGNPRRRTITTDVRHPPVQAGPLRPGRARPERLRDGGGVGGGVGAVRRPRRAQRVARPNRAVPAAAAVGGEHADGARAGVRDHAGAARQRAAHPAGGAVPGAAATGEAVRAAGQPRLRAAAGAVAAADGRRGDQHGVAAVRRHVHRLPVPLALLLPAVPPQGRDRPRQGRPQPAGRPGRRGRARPGRGTTASTRRRRCCGRTSGTSARRCAG